ncbi:AI-2E family transporter [Butyrivibrio sp. MC2021]|uniref:AI-2E family transporter n=1 Tax=Butyrivibrio sp. MC2021 TaxID=1408306 RepID=UPI00047A0C9D|nr:AI-2E family transporter [Butyrivibrio sp. MC2021]
MKFNNKWFKKRWVANTIALCSAVAFYMILKNLFNIFTGVGSFFSFLKPIIVAAVIAYIFNPVAKLFETKVLKKMKNRKTAWKLSVALALIVIILAVTLLFVALIPQLADSIMTLASNMGGYIDSAEELLGEFQTGQQGFFGLDLAALATFTEKALTTITGYISSSVPSLVSTSANIGKSVFDLVISFILAVYLLLDKERLINGFSRLFALLMKDETYHSAGSFIEKCNAILIRYISFDIVDGIVVGVVNLIFMLIAGMPYSVVISFIVGITNLAPTFGPIVGAAIGAFILVLVKPWYALAFLIFTIILQTVDGYILKPRLFGESLGVSPLMILISIILGGRLFGVVGILLAIPFAAIIDFVWHDYVIKKLELRRAKKYNI